MSNTHNNHWPMNHPMNHCPTEPSIKVNDWSTWWSIINSRKQWGFWYQLIWPTFLVWTARKYPFGTKLQMVASIFNKMVFIYMHHLLSILYNLLGNSGCIVLSSGRTSWDCSHYIDNKPGFQNNVDEQLCEMIGFDSLHTHERHVMNCGRKNEN